MADEIEGDSTRWIILKNNEVLLTSNLTLPNKADISSIEETFLRCFHVGNINNVSYYTAELDLNTLLPQNLATHSLRSVLSLFDEAQFRLGVKAYSIITWDKNHQCCGQCGASTLHHTGSFERVCSACMLSFFPRISPAVIVLIRKEDHVLMARNHHFPPKVYSVLAGFVEPGETIEEAIHREIKEEVNIEVKNLSYFGSQAWPFPDSLMIAFFADYAAGEIKIDQQELEDANWYKYDNLPDLHPGNMSIGAKLLESFVNSFKKG